MPECRAFPIRLRPQPRPRQKNLSITDHHSFRVKENLVSSKRLVVRIAASFFALFVVISTASGQVASYTKRPLPIAERNNLYCAGYVQTAPVNTSMQIVGGQEEQEQYAFSQNNAIYINAGSKSNLKEGDVLTVFRPRGKVSNKISEKSGNLGFYVQEVGAVELIRVKEDHSIAKVKVSCDNFMFGDLVEPATGRTSPLFKERLPLDRYADPSGKAVGKLFLTREAGELITRDNIVYVDLGAEDNVKVGDYLTVFRKLGKGNLFHPGEGESVQNSSSGFASDHFGGTTFSNQAPRRGGDKGQGGAKDQSDAKSDRPKELRKVVGELVVLNVKERTATAVVVRTGQEIQPGDYVEIQ